MSQVKVKVELLELPALSMTVNLMTYTPSTEAEILVVKVFKELKVITPGPDTILQIVVDIPDDGDGSVAVPVLENKAFVVMFPPALTTGEALSQTKLNCELAEFPAASVTVNLIT